MTKTQWSTSSYASWAVVILAPLLLLLIPYLRGWEGYGTEHYLIERLSTHQGFYDQLSYGGRAAAYPWAVPALVKFLGNLEPAILGLLAMLLLSLIFRKHIQNAKNLALLLVAISPPFVTMFSSYNFESSALVLLLSVFLLLHQKGRLQWLSIPVSVLLPFFSFEYAIIGAALLLIFALTEKKNEFAYASSLATIFSTVTYYAFFLSLDMQATIFNSLGDASFHSRLNELISEFSGLYGLGIFFIILAIIGLTTLWKEKYSNKFLFFSFAALLFFALALPKAAVLLNILFSAFAAIGLLYLYQKPWENSTLRFLTLLVLVCGLLFSSVSHIRTLTALNPDQKIIEAMDYLKDQEQSVVFSYYSRGEWISHTGHINVMDSYAYFAPDFKERLTDSNALFQARDYAVSKGILDKYAIRYIWIDSFMKRKLWNNDVEGLRFITQYSQDFEKVFSNGEVEIWEVKPSAVPGL
ncbi:hypothetical protein HY501_00885 [Candidatus Woesearchaeota archaeon]|nr:hypothetical protein [Candidatus Woesearchaeota archaeon]